MPQVVNDPNLLQAFQDAQAIRDAGGDPSKVMASDSYKKYGLRGVMKGQEGTQGSSFVGGWLRTPIEAVNQGLNHAGNAVRHIFQDHPEGTFGDNEVAYADTLPKVTAAREEAARHQRGRDGIDWANLAGTMLTPLPGGGEAQGVKALIKAGAKQGAGAAALSPVDMQDGDSFLAKKLGQVGVGAAAGGAFGLPLAGLGAMGRRAAAKAVATGTTRDTIDAAQRLGLTRVGMAQATQSEPLAMLANVSRKMPFGTPIKEGAQTTISEMQGLRDKVANEMGKNSDSFTTGFAAKGALEAGLGRNVDHANTLYAAVDKHDKDVKPFIPAGFITSIRSQSGEFSPLMQKLGENFDNPTLKKWFDDMTIKQDDQIVGINPMTFKDAQLLRSRIGVMMKEPQVINGIPGKDLRTAYRALSNDMGEALDSIPDKDKAVQASEAWNKATSYWEYVRAKQKNVLQPIIDSTPEDAINGIIKIVHGNADGARHLRDTMTPVEWGDVASHIFGKLGEPSAANRDAANQGFSVAGLLTGFNKLRHNKQAFDWAFGGTQFEKVAPTLTDLAKVSDAIKRVDKLGNPSASGYYGGIIGMVAGLFTGHVYSAGMIMGANSVFAKAMASPRAAKALLNLAKGAHSAMTGAGHMSEAVLKSRVMRLSGIVTEEQGQQAGQAIYNSMTGGQ